MYIYIYIYVYIYHVSASVVALGLLHCPTCTHMNVLAPEGMSLIVSYLIPLVTTTVVRPVARGSLSSLGCLVQEPK